MADTLPKVGEFSEGKLWYNRKGLTVVLGLTNSALRDVGSVETIDFPTEGEKFDQGDVVMTIDGTHGKFELVAPASGNVVEINGALHEEPDMISEDPLEEGWLVKIEIEDASELKDYIEAEA